MADWTPETLLAHLYAIMEREHRSNEQRFTDQERAVQAALNAAKEAVLKAETAAEKRFEGVNEFRATLADQQRTLIPRAEAELRFDSLEKRLTMSGDVLEKKLEAMAVQFAQAIGQRTGGREMWAYIVAAIGVILGVLSFILGRWNA